MSTTTEITLDGAEGKIVVQAWPNAKPRYLALLAHGFAEHAGRYAHVAAHLVEHGAVVYAPDHLGHGRSDGERGLVRDSDVLAADLHRVADRARALHPGLPLVLVGHSMGGILATRFAQLYPGELTALVLSAPVIGGNPGFEALLKMDPIPEIPIDPRMLSRDPAVGEAYAADDLVYHGPLKRPTLEALSRSVAVIAAGPTLGALPTLWMHGENDSLAPFDVSRAAVERIRGSALVSRTYPGAAHEIFNETNRDEVLRDTTEFLERVLR